MQTLLTNNTRILAIDPGRAKCGVAVIEPPRILFRSILTPDAIRDELPRLINEYSVTRVVIGAGTSRDCIEAVARSAAPQTPVELQAETGTTLEARRRYFQANPQRGWRRLIPISMQVPPEPYDDFAAVVLGERFLAKWTQND